MSFIVGHVEGGPSKRFINAVTPATNGLAGAVEWVQGTSYNTLFNAVLCAIRIDCTLSSASSGMLIEAGGNGRGLAIYCSGGSVYFECGRGDLTGGSADSAFVQYPLPSDPMDLIVEISCNGPAGDARLFINGGMVDQDTSWTSSQVTGGDEGEIVSTGSLIRVTQPGGGDPLTNGSISLALVFPGVEI